MPKKKQSQMVGNLAQTLENQAFVGISCHKYDLRNKGQKRIKVPVDVSIATDRSGAETEYMTLMMRDLENKELGKEERDREKIAQIQQAAVI